MLRVIYYYHSERMPLFLLTAYGKSVKSDLAESEKVVMRRLVQELKDQFLRRAVRLKAFDGGKHE